MSSYVIGDMHLEDTTPILESYKEYTDDVVSKLQYLVDFMDKCGWLEDHCFTFNDGDVWRASNE